MQWELLPNGDILPETSPTSFGSLLFGYSIYTTLRWPLPDRWWQAHIDRLSGNAKALGLDWPFQERLLRIALAKVAAPEGIIFRLTAFASSDAYGALFQNTQLPVRLCLHARPIPGSPTQPVKLRSVSYKRPLPLIKQGSMAESILLKREAQAAGMDDVLFISEAGYLRESSTANIFAIFDGKLVTPSPERDGCLPGITRQQVKTLAENRGITCSEEEPIPLTELLQAHGAFMTNAAQGIIPVESINGQAIPWTEQAREMLSTLQAILALS